jgi:NAD+ synthase (glutamine-hydrolysing)
MKIALAQINPTVGDFSGNTEKIVNYIKKARDKGVDLIIFPELALSGYPPKDLLFKYDFHMALKNALKTIINNTSGIYVLLGSPEIGERYHPRHLDQSRRCDSSGYKIYNSAFLIYNRKVIFVQQKTYLPSYDVFNEERYFEPAAKRDVISIKDLKLGITICEDIWVSDHVISELKEKGANLIINISASPFYAGKYKLRHKLIRTQALSNKIPVLYCNMVGGTDELVFDGGSMGYDENGKLILLGARFKEDLAVLTDRSTPIRNYPRDENEISEIYEAIILGLKDYVQKNKFQKVIVGLSGGIDSAVVAVLAAQALGKENVELVIMPGPFTPSYSINDAIEVAQNLEIAPHLISINGLYRSYLRTLKPKFKNRPFDTTEENIQARIRGNILMALSNKFGYLVLITGNKSEFAVGYSTLYGDMAGGLGIIMDLYKTQVYKLAYFLNKTSNKELIPERIIKKPPSAELRPHQTDQDDLPPYEVLDKILYLYLEQNLTKEAIIKKGFNRTIVEDIICRIHRNEYKRKQAPLGLKLTPKAFGSGRTIPITHKFLT